MSDTTEIEISGSYIIKRFTDLESEVKELKETVGYLIVALGALKNAHKQEHAVYGQMTVVELLPEHLGKKMK